MGLNLNGVQSHSALAGLVDLGTVDADTLNINGLTLGIASPSGIYNILLKYPSPDVISIINVSVKGASAGISNFSFPLYGSLYLYDFSNNFNMAFVVTSALEGRNIQLQLGNNTVGSPVNVPSLTINVHAHIYTYPF